MARRLAGQSGLWNVGLESRAPGLRPAAGFSRLRPSAAHGSPMDITEETRIPSPLAEVWPLLSDPAVVAGCIPGATLAPDQGDGIWRGAIRVKFGPTAAVFRGEAILAFDNDAHRCSIEGRGIDQRGASRA